MRVVNENHETITEYDLTAGRLIPATAIREDATPIDNITKFAWYDEDYEEVQMYVPTSAPTAAERIEALKNQLSATDYKIIKCSECQMVGKEMPYDVAALHAERQVIRDQINQLEVTENE